MSSEDLWAPAAPSTLSVRRLASTVASAPSSRLRNFSTPEARNRFIDDLVENEQVDAAARLGWTDNADPLRRPNPFSAVEIESAWMELEAAVAIQSHARARLAARLYKDRMRKLQLFRLYARTEERAAKKMQEKIRRLLAHKDMMRKWRDTLNAAAALDPNAISERLARAAALVQTSQRAAHRAALLNSLRGTLHVRTRRGLLFGRFEEKHVFATDDPGIGAAICWRGATATAAERTVPIASVRVHSELRYEFAIEAHEGKSGGGKSWLFRAPAQHTLEQWMRNLHALVIDGKRDAVVGVADNRGGAGEQAESSLARSGPRFGRDRV